MVQSKRALLAWREVRRHFQCVQSRRREPASTCRGSCWLASPGEWGRIKKTAQISIPWSKTQGEAAGSQTAKDTGMAKNSGRGLPGAGGAAPAGLM
jgi:hypothetical protein